MIAFTMKMKPRINYASKEMGQVKQSNIENIKLIFSLCLVLMSRKRSQGSNIVRLVMILMRCTNREMILKIAIINSLGRVTIWDLFWEHKSIKHILYLMGRVSDSVCVCVCLSVSVSSDSCLIIDLRC